MAPVMQCTVSLVLLTGVLFCLFFIDSRLVLVVRNRKHRDNDEMEDLLAITPTVWFRATPQHSVYTELFSPRRHYQLNRQFAIVKDGLFSRAYFSIFFFIFRWSGRFPGNIPQDNWTIVKTRRFIGAPAHDKTHFLDKSSAKSTWVFVSTT